MYMFVVTLSDGVRRGCKVKFVQQAVDLASMFSAYEFECYPLEG